MQFVWGFCVSPTTATTIQPELKLCNVHCPRLKNQLVGNGAMFYDIIASHLSWFMMVFGEIKAIPPILCIWASNNNISHIRDGRWVLVSHSRWSSSWRWSSSCLTFKMVDFLMVEFLSCIQDGRFLVSQVPPMDVKIKNHQSKAMGDE
jgi:hypothetical protein